MNAAEYAEKVAAHFGEKVLETVTDCHDPYCLVDPMSIDEVALYCRDDLGFDYLECLSAVDYMDKKKTTDDLGVVYHLGSIFDGAKKLCLKVRLTRESPVTKTVEKVWRTADWHEREAWDMVGVEFEGHHNLTRILCAEDWVGHPLRKDYKSPDEYHGIKNNVV